MRLTIEDLYVVELMSLFLTIRFAAKKVVEVDEVPMYDPLRRNIEKQVERLKHFS